MTLDEYWGWQDTQELRHEFVGGVVYAITGGSRPHARISMNIHALLHAAQRRRACMDRTIKLTLDCPDVTFQVADLYQ
jgi:Putative restriction endonuclease